MSFIANASFQTEGMHTWRHQVLDVALKLTSVVMPLLLVAVVAARRDEPFDGFIVVYGLVVALLVALRFSPQLGFAVRAAGFVAGLQIAAIDAVASSGLVPGSGMAALVSVCLTGIFFGRRVMMLVLLITPLSYIVVGWLVAHNGHQLRLQDADPTVYVHWVRASVVIASLSALLGVAVDHLVKQVESGYRAAVESAAATRTAYDQLGMLHRRLELAKEEQRSLLARELHDEMGQTLTVLKLHMQLLFRGSGAATPKQQAELLELVDRLISHVRKISLDLRPTMLDELGLEPALAAFVDSHVRRDGVQMTLEVEGFTERLSPEIEHACFRLVQESVTNTLRHANAKRLVIQVRREQGHVRIAVKDDGSGFSAQEAASKAARGHLGLVGMRERVRLLGGEMIVTASTSESAHPGTSVNVTLPSTPPRAP